MSETIQDISLLQKIQRLELLDEETTKLEILNKGMTVTDAAEFIEIVLDVDREIDCKMTRNQDGNEIVFRFEGKGKSLAKIYRNYLEKDYGNS